MKTKQELLVIIKAQADELSSIMGLLDGYRITRMNGKIPLSPYGRVLAAIRLLHKCGAVESSDSELDEPTAYMKLVLPLLLKGRE